MLKDEEILDRVSYHAPSIIGVETHGHLTSAIYAAMREVEALCPDSREKSLAMTKLEEAKMWASAAVARDPDTR